MDQNVASLAEPVTEVPAPVSAYSEGVDRFGEPVTPSAERMWQRLKDLDLLEEVAHLEVKGYCVVPPEKVGPPEFAARLREAVLDVCERRTGSRPVVDGNGERVTSGSETDDAFGALLPYILFEDPVFQEAILNPVSMALNSYLLGENNIVYSCLGGVKGPGGGDLFTHCDQNLMSSPFPPHAQVANANYALTDYDADSGPIFFVPGSHRAYRHPMPGEGQGHRTPVTCKAGSIIFFYGQTWHGAFARQRPGVRINLISAFTRPHIRPQEPYRENVTAEMLGNHPPEFAKLMGQHLNFGWKEEGPQNADTAYNMGRHVYD